MEPITLESRFLECIRLARKAIKERDGQRHDEIASTIVGILAMIRQVEMVDRKFRPTDEFGAVAVGEELFLDGKKFGVVGALGAESVAK